MAFHCAAPFHSECTSIPCLPYYPLTQGAWGGMYTLAGHGGSRHPGGRGIDSHSVAQPAGFHFLPPYSVHQSQKCISSPLALQTYLEIRCLANSPLGSSQNKMTNSSTNVRLKRSLFVCANHFLSQNLRNPKACTTAGPAVFIAGEEIQNKGSLLNGLLSQRRAMVH